MKQIITILLLFISISVLAQDLKVESFSATTQILQADKRKNDSNGDPCAVVEVLLPDDGANFVGNLVGSPQFNINKYWVYMTEGSKQLQINLRGYNALNVYFGEYGVNSLKQNTIYELKVSKLRQQNVLTQTLSIKVKPSNAIVLIDGDIQETTNGQATLTLPVGNHTYNVVAEGYKKQQGEVKLSTDAPGTLIIELDKVNDTSVQQSKMATITPEQESTSLNVDELFNTAFNLFNNSHFSRAVPFFTVLAEKGHVQSQYYLGYFYDQGLGVSQDYAKAVEWYTKAANQGNADAQNNLAYCYDQGLGVPQDDSKAVEWYTKAANQGNDRAQMNLGICYFNGLGVPQDYSKAVEWYTTAATQGRADAQNNLGLCYKNGKGVRQNYSKAVEWLTKAANQGHVVAQNNLGICYENGEGVKKDQQKAIEWYKKAAAQGSSKAKTNLERLGVSY